LTCGAQLEENHTEGLQGGHTKVTIGIGALEGVVEMFCPENAIAGGWSISSHDIAIVKSNVLVGQDGGVRV
jgi:hypothetical protein